MADPIPKFKRGDIIIPKDKLGEPFWVQWALQVLNQLEDGTVIAAPYWGGAEKKFPLEKIRKWNFVKVAPGATPVYQKALFTAGRFNDKGKSYVGWTTGELWNGWGTPHFEYDEALRVVSDLEGWLVRYDPQKDRFILVEPEARVPFEWMPQEDYEEDEGVWVVQAEHIQALEEGVSRTLKVYGIGAFSWTWEPPRSVLR